MRHGAAFSVFGFPVHVRSGFLVFMALVVFVNGPGIGLWLAAFLALFTLLHELGHAFAARATGAEAEIALDFLAGYAAFVPTRPLKRWERAGISFAGPATQIAIGLAFYVGMGGDVSFPIGGLSDAQIAVLWAGPVIGLFNLIPILPFDGGNIALAGLEAIAPRQARRIMLVFTAVFAVAAIAFMLFRPEWRGLVIFALVPLVSVFQQVSSERHRSVRLKGHQAVARAEDAAWATGDVTHFPAGHVPSPWFRAHQQLQRGDPDTARQVLLADFGDAGPVNWWPPDSAPPRALEPLVALLPRPIPHGRPFSDYVLAGVLLRLADYPLAATYAAESYNAGRSPMLALAVSRAAAALGDSDTAIAWLRAAAAGGTTSALAAAVAEAPEFEVLDGDPDFRSIIDPSPAARGGS